MRSDSSLAPISGSASTSDWVRIARIKKKTIYRITLPRADLTRFRLRSVPTYGQPAPGRVNDDALPSFCHRTPAHPVCKPPVWCTVTPVQPSRAHSLVRARPVVIRCLQNDPGFRDDRREAPSTGVCLSPRTAQVRRLETRQRGVVRHRRRTAAGKAPCEGEGRPDRPCSRRMRRLGMLPRRGNLPRRHTPARLAALEVHELEIPPRMDSQQERSQLHCEDALLFLSAKPRS